MAQWNISETNTNRVRSAMNRQWHTAEPILRVYRVDKEPQIATIRRVHVADVPVNIQVKSWYVPVENPPCSFMLELGYHSREGEFFVLASSNVVDTPPKLMHDAPFGTPVTGLGAGLYDRGASSSSFQQFGGGAPWGAQQGGFYARPFAETEHAAPGAFGAGPAPFGSTSSPSAFGPAAPFGTTSAFGAAQHFGAPAFARQPAVLSLEVSAEIVVKGKATPGASVRIKDEQLPVKEDGSFSVRLELGERRHVFPVCATSRDESESRTVILAIDRNTKILDPVYKEDEE